MIGNQTAHSTSPSPDTWESIRPELEKRFGEPGQASAASAIAEANSAAAQLVLFGYTSAVDSRGPSTVSGQVQAAAGTVVRAFWWGFHVEIGHDDLERILAAADVVNAVVGAIGGNIPSPAQPWIRLLAPFVASLHDGLRRLDEGCGVYISMSWFAPGVFIPTTVPC